MSMLPNARMRKKNGAKIMKNDDRLHKSWQRYKLSFVKTCYSLLNSVLTVFLGFDCDVNFVELVFQIGFTFPKAINFPKVYKPKKRKPPMPKSARRLPKKERKVRGFWKYGADEIWAALN